MTFEEIERLAANRQPMQCSDLEVLFCYQMMIQLYKDFESQEISQEQAHKKKLDIKYQYEQVCYQHNSQRAAFAQYQENIRNAGYLLSEITKGLQNDTEVLTLLLQSVECICCMTGETVLLDIAKREVERRRLSDGTTH